MAGRNKDATWRTLDALCRELGWPWLRLWGELRARRVPYRTYPEGVEIDWSDPNLDVDRVESTVTIAGLLPAETEVVGFSYTTVAVEVLPPADDSAPSPPAQRWRKRPPVDVLRAAAIEAAKTFQPADPPTQPEWWAALNGELGAPVTRKIALDVLNKWAPHLKRQPGQKRNRQM
jgi:hypothetical protein